MKAELKVSVIVPCYNAERFVQDAITSILSQTHQNLELICVDDGSTDGTAGILKQLADSDDRLNVISSENNGGSAARNLGLGHATGDVIQFFDADDVMHPQKLEKQLLAIEEGADVVISDYDTKDIDLKEVLNINEFGDILSNPLKCAVERVISTNNPIYKKKIVDELGGYDTELQAAQDWDFNLRMIFIDPKVSYVPGIFVTVRQTGDSVSSDWHKVSRINCDLLTKYRGDIMNHRQYDDTIGSYCCNVYYNTLVHAIETEADLLHELKNWNMGTAFLASKAKRVTAGTLGLESLIRMDRKRQGSG